MMMNNDSQGYFFHSNVSNWIFDWLKITFSFKSFYPDIKLFLISPTLFFLKFESRSQFKKAIIIGINGNTNWAFSKGVTTYLTFLINNSNFNSAHFELYLMLYAMHCTTMFFAEVEICVREREWVQYFSRRCRDMSD